MAGMRESASAGPLCALWASSQKAGPAGRALGSGKCPSFLVSVAVVRIGQEQFETTAGAAHQACEESGLSQKVLGHGSVGDVTSH